MPTRFLIAMFVSALAIPGSALAQSSQSPLGSVRAATSASGVNNGVRPIQSGGGLRMPLDSGHNEGSDADDPLSSSSLETDAHALDSTYGSQAPRVQEGVRARVQAQRTVMTPHPLQFLPGCGWLPTGSTCQPPAPPDPSTAGSLRPNGSEPSSVLSNTISQDMAQALSMSGLTPTSISVPVSGGLVSPAAPLTQSASPGSSSSSSSPKAPSPSKHR